VKMEVTRSFKMSVLTRSTRRHIPEDGILQTGRKLHAAVFVVSISCFR
jgi:hypothetical protein